jgi:hypothetical protein
VVTTIRLRSGSEAELQTRAGIEELIASYDLAPWTFTDELEIDEFGYPHSHPILTLDTSTTDPHLLLAALVHEQLHWFEEQHARRRDVAITATNELWPVVPADRPEGAGSEESTRLHLLVCHWEHRALERLVGVDTAREIIASLATHHYRWIYQTVLSDREALEELVARHGLVPPALV